MDICLPVTVIQAEHFSTESYMAMLDTFTCLLTINTCNLFPDYAAVFSKLIARTAKDIDVLIDSLPSEESSLELQVHVFFFFNFLLVEENLSSEICR